MLCIEFSWFGLVGCILIVALTYCVGGWFALWVWFGVMLLGLCAGVFVLVCALLLVYVLGCRVGCDARGVVCMVFVGGVCARFAAGL